MNNRRHTESFKIVKSTKNKLVVSFKNIYINIFLGLMPFIYFGSFFVIDYFIQNFFLSILYVILLVFILFLNSFFIKKYLLRKVEITRHYIKFEYLISIHNRFIYKPSTFVDILVLTNEEKLEIELFGTRIPIKSAADFPNLLDHITKVLQLELSKSIERSAGKDVLLFKPVKTKKTK